MKKTVKHDNKIQSIIFKVCLSAFTDNPLNFGLRGPSSLGKTYNVTETLKYFPEEDVWLLGGLSKKALIHSYGVLCDENGNEINLSDSPTKESVELQLRDFYSNLSEKPTSKEFRFQVKQELEKQKREWKEKIDKSHYVIDLKNKILVFLEAPDIGVFNILRPILSHDAKEISYKIADKNSSGSLRTKHVIIRNFPAVIFCTTDLYYLEDIATRFITATPEISKEKFEAANRLTGHKNALPFEFEEGEDLFNLKTYPNFLKAVSQHVDVILPFGQELGEAYPSFFARSMRDLKHFIVLIKVSAFFHYAQRPVLTVEEKDYLLATEWDYNHVKELWEDVEETTLTGLSGHILNFYKKAVKEYLDASGQDFASIETLTEKYNETATERRSSDTVRKWVSLLCEVGWLTKSDDPDDKRRVRISIIKNSENNGNCRIPEFRSFFSEYKLRNWLEQVKKLSEEKPVLLRENFLSEYIKQDIIDMPKSISKAYSFIKETEKKPYSKPEFVSDNYSAPSETEKENKEENKPKKSGFRESPLFLGSLEQVRNYVLNNITDGHILKSEVNKKSTELGLKPSEIIDQLIEEGILYNSGRFDAWGVSK